MADTLLFRGGSSADITASTVQSREIVIDTDTDQIVSGASKKKTVMEDSNGDVEIGGGNITLGSDGDITTAGKITIERATPAFFLKKDNATANEGTYSFSVIGDSSLVIQGRNDINTAGSSYFKFSRVANSNSIDAFVGLRSTTPWFEVNNTDKVVRIGGTLPSAPTITLASDGAITAGTYNGLTVGTGNGGINNTVVGSGTFAGNTTGNNNTATGGLALAANTEGSSNTAIGRQALTTNTTGSSNTGIGWRSLYSNTIGTKNAVLGYESGFYIEGSFNTILGAYKGTAADATLNSTVIISAGNTERARCDSNGDWDFGSIILKSPDGTSFRLSVANDGTLSASAV